MKLPNYEQAVVYLEKLRDYCLNTEHPKGKHKARVFTSALGLTAENAEELRDILLAAAQTYDAIATKQNDYGQYYIIDLTITRAGKQAVVRSSWIIRTKEDFP